MEATASPIEKPKKDTRAKAAKAARVAGASPTGCVLVENSQKTSPP
jgi:hypothetical protein